MIKITIRLLYLLLYTHSSFADIIGAVEYQVTHIPNTQELHVKVQFDAKNVTHMSMPACTYRSDMDNIIRDIKISANPMGITWSNVLNFSFVASNNKEHVTIEYTLRNIKTSQNLYIGKDGFYLTHEFLVFPSAAIDNEGKSAPLKANIKFNTPVSNMIFSSHGKIKTNYSSDLPFTFDKFTGMYNHDAIVYIAGASNILKTSRIKVSDEPLDLLFFRIHDREIKELSVKTQKIFALEDKFWGEKPHNNIHTPFMAYIRNPNIDAIQSSAMHIGNSVLYIASDSSEYTTTHIAHEHIHDWINETLLFSSTQQYMYEWFTEGFTEYYAHKTTFASGLITPQDLIAKLNYMLGVFRLGELRYTSYIELSAMNYTSFMYYVKGFLLASELDQKIIAETKGKYSLDDAMLSVIKKCSRSGFSEELLMSEIRQLTGFNLGNILGAIEYSDNLTPTTTPLGLKTKIYEIQAFVPQYGFDIAKSVIMQQVIDLKLDSPAYLAGLREGDFLPRDKLLGRSYPAPGPQTVTLTIGAGPTEKTITYTTDSEKIMVPQYELVE